MINEQLIICTSVYSFTQLRRPDDDFYRIRNLRPNHEWTLIYRFYLSFNVEIMYEHNERFGAHR